MYSLIPTSEFPFESVLTSAQVRSYFVDNLDWLLRSHFRCSARRTTNQLVGHDDVSAITLHEEDYDVGGWHAGGAGAERLTVPAEGDGLYAIFGHSSWQGNTTGRRGLTLYHNGSPVSGVSDSRSADPSGTTSQLVATEMELNAGDFIELRCIQTSGVALNITSARLKARWVATKSTVTPPP